MSPDKEHAIRTAKWTILRDNAILPVTNMFDNLGCEVENPLRAFRCVVYRRGQFEVHRCAPGEIAWARNERALHLLN